jgi:hypothetical protein
MPGRIEPDTDAATNPSILQRNNNERIGGELGYHRSLWQRGQDLRVAYRNNEFRIDTDHSNLSSLQHKYAKEFALAEKRQLERKDSWGESWKMNVKYDYERDPMFNAWREDKKRAMEVLHIHLLDDWLDDPLVLVTHSMKVTTTLGGAQGALRAHGMWKTIDQNYAKMNGLTYRSLIVQEVALGILRGALVGVSCGIGCLLGDNLARFISCVVIDQTVARDRRKWQSIVVAAGAGGLAAGSAMSFLGRDLISVRAQVLLCLSMTSLGLMTGFAAGYWWYKPFQDAHPVPYDEPYWRPWNKREFQYAGPPGIRGRYV